MMMIMMIATKVQTMQLSLKFRVYGKADACQMRKEWSVQTLRKSNALGLIYGLCYSSLLGYPRGMGENIHNS